VEFATVIRGHGRADRFPSSSFVSTLTPNSRITVTRRHPCRWPGRPRGLDVYRAVAARHTGARRCVRRCRRARAQNATLVGQSSYGTAASARRAGVQLVCLPARFPFISRVRVSVRVRAVEAGSARCDKRGSAVAVAPSSARLCLRDR
jgi:hypothetical protein